MYFRTGNPKGLTESGSGELGIIVCGRVPWLYQYWPGGFMLFVVLCPGTPGGSTGSGSGFKDICGYFQCAPFPRLQTGTVVRVLSFDP